MSEDRIRLEFAVSGNNFASAGSASEEVKSTLKKLGIPSKDIRRVAIAMYEGEINMVIHAGTPGWSTAPENIRALGFGAGMGLPNMKKYTDKFEIESEVGVGTTVRMTIYFN